MTTIVFFLILVTLTALTGIRQQRADTSTFVLSRDYTNALRGLAMMFIIFCHVGSIYGQKTFLLLNPFVSPGVMLFLALSGYGNNESYLKKGKFPLTKLLKLAIPYWIARSLVIVGNGGTLFSLSPERIMDYCFIQNNNVFWFAGFLMKWYFVYWICTKWLYKYRWTVMIAFGILLCVLKENQTQVLCFPFGVWLSENKDKLKELTFATQMKIAAGFFAFGSISLIIKHLPNWGGTKQSIMCAPAS